MGLKSNLVESLPFVGMVMVEILTVGLTTLSKAAMSRGMNHYVFVVYSNALATLIFLPIFIFFQIKNRPPLNFSLLCKFFILSLVGITVMQNCAFTGIKYSSPTLAFAMSNLIPAMTFLLAVVFRMEKLDIRSSRSQIKILGTLLSISGALTVTFYKGPSIIAISSTNLLFSQKQSLFDMFIAASDTWVTGALFLLVSTSSIAIWNTAQAVLLKGYPSQITIVSFCCLFGTIQCAVVALIAVRDPSSWKLGLDIELIAILYSAVFGSGVSAYVQIWCIQTKGPVFVAMFKPMGIAIAALMGVTFLGDILYVGSVVGSVIIAAGFYGVIWAQSKEGKCEKHETDKLTFPTQATPLLSSHGDA